MNNRFSLTAFALAITLSLATLSHAQTSFAQDVAEHSPVQKGVPDDAVR